VVSRNSYNDQNNGTKITAITTKITPFCAKIMLPRQRLLARYAGTAKIAKLSY